MLKEKSKISGTLALTLTLSPRRGKYVRRS